MSANTSGLDSIGAGDWRTQAFKGRIPPTPYQHQKSAQAVENMRVIGFPLRKRVRNRLKMLGLHVYDKEQSTCTMACGGEEFGRRRSGRAGKRQTRRTIAYRRRITEV